MNTLLISEKSDCCGCSACKAVCPQKCIEMKPDREGFLYPTVNNGNCIHCNKCVETCPVISRKERMDKKPVAYAAMNRDEAVRKTSSLGGVFALIAETVLNDGGAVFGAAFDENRNVRHICAENREQTELIKGSKYAQSETGDCYSSVKKLLKSGKSVLFTGTPCQTEGLSSYLSDTDCRKLYTQDIICHGASSPLIWSQYVNEIKRITGNITSISQRDKLSGWYGYSFTASGEKGSYSNSHSTDPFMFYFLHDFILRPSCYNCPFKGRKRSADITLGDFWGVDRAYPDMFDDKGTSLVIVNTEKGEQLFRRVSDRLRYKEVLLDTALMYNTAADKSAVLPEKRDNVFAQLRKRGIIQTYNKSHSDPDRKLIMRIKNKIKAILKVGSK